LLLEKDLHETGYDIFLFNYHVEAKETQRGRSRGSASASTESWAAGTNKPTMSAP